MSRDEFCFQFPDDIDQLNQARHAVWRASLGICSLALSGHPATAAERRYVRLSRSLRVTRPRSNDVRLIVHGTPLVRKSSACEVSQSTVMRRTFDLREQRSSREPVSA